MNGRRWLSSLAMMMPALAVCACDAAEGGGADTTEGSGGAGGGGEGSGGSAEVATDSGRERGPVMAAATPSHPSVFSREETDENEESLKARPEIDQVGEVGWESFPVNGVESEACPGEALVTLALAGTTSTGSGTRTMTGFVDDHDTCWTSGTPSADGSDMVFRIVQNDPGILTLDLSTNGFDGKLVIRDTCATEGYCFDTSSGTGIKSEKAAIWRPAGTTYVIVDSGGVGATGTFVLNATLTAPSCGDGVVSGSEQCDPGGTKAGDGCHDTTCQIELVAAGTAGDTCASATPITVSNVAGGTNFAVDATETAFTTNGYNNDYIGNCMPDVGGADRVFAITPATSGVLRAKVGFDATGGVAWCDSIGWSDSRCFDVELYVRTTCEASSATEIACTSACCSGETMDFPVSAGVPIYLFVDGYDAEYYSRGPFNVHLEYLP